MSQLDPTRGWPEFVAIVDAGSISEPAPARRGPTPFRYAWDPLRWTNGAIVCQKKVMPVHHTTCHLCEAMCGLRVTLKQSNITRIEGDPEDPLSRGHICPKGAALADLHVDPDRLRTPLIKVDGEWKAASWVEALDLAAEKLSAVRTRFGRDAVALYLGNPNVHSLGSALCIQALTRALRTTNRFSATSVDQLPHHLAAWAMLGHQFLIPVPDIDRTDFLFVLGANPVVSGGSLWTVPGFEKRTRAMQARGGRFVVVDPRRTRTAELADEHVFIRPGTDVYFLLSLVQQVISRADLGHLRGHTMGLEALEAATASWTPERTAERTGVPAEITSRLASALLETERAAIYGRMGLSTQAFGTACQWLLMALNVLTGNLDREGGMMLTSPALDIVEPHRAGSFGRRTSRVRGLPEFSGELPVCTMAEEMLTNGPGQVKALVTVAGNPVLSTPDGGQMDRALEGLDAFVAIDIYLNETTRHADVILPPTTGLETPRYDIIFNHFAVRNTAKFSPPVAEAGPEQRAEYWIFRELAARLATEETPWNPDLPANSMSLEQMLDFGLRTGPHKLSLAMLSEHPSGLDLGPLEAGQLPERLHTPDGMIQLAPPLFVADLERVGGAVVPSGLLMIGRRDLRTNNSWLHNSPRLTKGRNRCTLQMHPDDAAHRSLTDGQTVTLKSRVGAIQIALETTTTVMPGVVCVPHGWGHGRRGVRMANAANHAGVSVNDVTDPTAIDELSGNAVLNGVPVEVLG
ncbi:MAG: anaerobic selenocysteine-containing dehydrogenase [Myxococcota bacterium]|jgi:anaerobic selenocysteine-containing dehydrogenase